MSNEPIFGSGHHPVSSHPRLDHCNRFGDPMNAGYVILCFNGGMRESDPSLITQVIGIVGGFDEAETLCNRLNDAQDDCQYMFERTNVLTEDDQIALVEEAKEQV